MAVLAGSWNATLSTPIGTMKVVFHITEVDGGLSGVATSDAESVEMVDIVADGDRLTWTQMVTTPMKLTLKFDVTVEDDRMSGGYKAGIFPSSKVEATRAGA